MPPFFTSLLFWIAAGGLASLAAYLVMRFARSAEVMSETGADPARAVYQRQLDEIDDLAAGGLLPQTERDAARAEAGRRLLSSNPAADEGCQPSHAPHRFCCGRRSGARSRSAFTWCSARPARLTKAIGLDCRAGGKPSQRRFAPTRSRLC